MIKTFCSDTLFILGLTPCIQNGEPYLEISM